jgi:hypothetical protein
MAKLLKQAILPTGYVEKGNKTVKNPDSLEAFTKETDKMVTGIFKNLESPGQTARVCCRLYKGQCFNEVFFHDREYTIPLSVAKFINQRIRYPIHKHTIDEKTGESRKDIGEMVQRYQFISAEYL